MTASDPHREAARRSPGHATWPAGHSRRSLPARRLRRQGAGPPDSKTSAAKRCTIMRLCRRRECGVYSQKNRGRRREAGLRSAGRLPCRGEVRKISVPSSPPFSAVCGLVKLEPLSRRRLCRRSRPAVSKHDGDTLTVPRLAPARLTQSSTSFEVEDCEAARAYFFFRRLVFFAPFFAADFVFVFRFFAMLPS